MILTAAFKQSPTQTISLETSDNFGNTTVFVTFTNGRTFDKELFKRDLENKPGFAGHLFTWESASNLGLLNAIQHSTIFDLVDYEPRGIQAEELPEGVVS